MQVSGTIKIYTAGNRLIEATKIITQLMMLRLLVMTGQCQNCAHLLVTIWLAQESEIYTKVKVT
jgi:hypothetical protein